MRMRFASVFVVSCMFMFLVISHVKGKEVEPVPYCKVITWYDVKCGADGNKTCVDHLIKGHIYDVPICDCSDLKTTPFGILCTCQHRFPCKEPPPLHRISIRKQIRG
ncbi:Plant self-incompatibility response [Arabidopsis suecica]|uniref:Plant self-incompatibility response n=1 Tax=Arabidopsis suecica TaxID=45249 RepID=A0A8T2BD93_ARASU|nr:Plant self-incompatibility response [Arabidopsis suecica]